VIVVEERKMTIPGFSASNSLRRGGDYTARTLGRGNSGQAVRPQLPVGGGGSSGDCVDRYQNCYVDCSVRYPESDDPNSLNGQLRQGCFDACDAAYRLCSPTFASRAIGRTIKRLARVVAPIVG
jgi:hypothetical protein